MNTNYTSEEFAIGYKVCPSLIQLNTMASKCCLKLVKVLKKILEPDSEIQSDFYLNQLLKFLTEENNTLNERGSKCDCKLVDANFFVVWLKAANEKWILSEKPDQNLVSFVLRLTESECKNEQIFVKLNSENVFENLLDNVAKNIDSPVVKLAFIKLMFSFLSHKSGLQWIISTNSWNKVYQMAIGSYTVYISREGCKFLTVFLQKSATMYENYCSTVIETILEPIKFCNINLSEDIIYNEVQSVLHVIAAILENLLEDFKISGDIQLLRKIINMFNIEKSIERLSPSSNMDFIFDVNQIIFLIYTYDIVSEFGNSKQPIPYHKILALSKRMYDKVCRLIETTDTSYILNNLINNIRYWSYVRDRMPVIVNVDMQPLSYEVQIELSELFPTFMFIQSMIGREETLSSVDDYRDMFYTKIFKGMVPETLRATFVWKKKIASHVSIADACLSLKCVAHSQKYYSREAANIAFQMLTYCLQDLLKCIENEIIHIPMTRDMCRFMEMLIATIIDLIKEFDINLKDGVETVSVLDTACNCLKISSLSAQIVMRSLQLSNMAISRYMCPSMVLLIDEDYHSILGVLVPILYAKLHDVCWEVRDSSLEVVHTIVDISNQKFPAYRNVILETDLPSVILRLIKKDEDPFVRSSALKCLQKMVYVKDYWYKIIEDNTIFDHLEEILQYEGEGIVRKLAAATISTIYEQQDISDVNRENFYNIMTHAATADLYWEVKVTALDFWQKDIFKHLTGQGMIDGSFPSVTFSTENKKIVVLTEAEVRKRLIKVLNQLSKTGCLSVFVVALQDENDVEVSKAALRHIQYFIDMLKKYEVSVQDEPVLTPTNQNNDQIFCLESMSQVEGTVSDVESVEYLLTEDISNMSNQPMNKDLVLENILDMKDLKLLEEVSNSFEYTKKDIQLKYKQFMPPSEFLNFLYNDFERYLQNRSKWINDQDNLESLLDDIIREYDYGNVQTMDCYA